MNIRRIMKNEGVILLSILLALLLNACSGQGSPTDTTKQSENTKQTTNMSVTSTETTQDKSKLSKSIMTDFEQLRSKNSTTGELLGFIKPQLTNLEKTDLDTAVKEILYVQQLQLKTYNDGTMAENFNTRMNTYKYEDLSELKNIKDSDSDIKTLLQNAYNDGLKLSTAEGMHYLEVDYVTLRTMLSEFVSEEISAYLDIMAEESSKHFAEDAALMISFDQLAERVVRNETFIEKYSNSKFIVKVKELHKYYLTAYLLGLNNTPAFNIKDNTLENKVLDSYKASLTKYPGTKLAEILEDYMSLLDKSNNKRTQDALDYAGKVTVE